MGGDDTAAAQRGDRGELSHAVLSSWGEATGVAPLEHPRINYAIPGYLPANSRP